VRLRPRLGLDHAAGLKAAHRGGVAVLVADEPRDPADLRALADIVRDGVLVVLALGEADVAGALEAFREACVAEPRLERELLGALVLGAHPRPCSECQGSTEVVDHCRTCFGPGVRGLQTSAEVHMPWP
jgi:type II secretory ATPase GspE/PulE/Tfp pilus assembly ATPase PilB-like protein